jgi:hypothetical protein
MSAGADECGEAPPSRVLAFKAVTWVMSREKISMRR